MVIPRLWSSCILASSAGSCLAAHPMIFPLHMIGPAMHFILKSTLFLSFLTGSLVAAAERPNVVWLISEDNSTHYLKIFDEHGAETPRIAELAKNGLLFRNAFSNAPVCSVARTTLMTSCFAPRIGTQYHRRSVVVPMPEGVEMFPAYLRKAGYYTTNNQKKDYNAEETQGTWDVSSSSASWRGRKGGQPFFHMQSFGATHEGSLHFNEASYRSTKTITNPKDVFVAPYHPDTDLFRYTVAKYHDNIRKVDAEIGAVVDQLAADGLLDDTFVFYFGDHGGVLPRGKGYAYESGLHVPLVVHVPKNFKEAAPWSVGAQVNGFVQFVDFGATVLNLAGVPLPDGIDGTPFLGKQVNAAEINARNTAIGYADRFDEKYDFVRTLRVGRYEYVRSYQPFNFDALQNNYRYIMLAYREWRELFEAGKLNEVQSQFFLARPPELLFDIESDPDEIHNLAGDPEFAETLSELRLQLQTRVKSMPDLSFYPENYLVDNAFANPTGFGREHKEDIASLVDIADLSLLPFDEARDGIVQALRSTDAIERYWGLIVCSSFSQKADALAGLALELMNTDGNRLVRVRAAEFLGLIGAEDPRPTIMECLKEADSGVEANLILNTVVLLQDGVPGYAFEIGKASLHPKAVSFQDVQRRLSYLTSENGVPVNPRGQPNKKNNKKK